MRRRHSGVLCNRDGRIAGNEGCNAVAGRCRHRFECLLLAVKNDADASRQGEGRDQKKRDWNFEPQRKASRNCASLACVVHFAFEHLGEGSAIRITLLGFFREKSVYDRAKSRWAISGDLSDRRDFALSNLDCEHCQFSAGESWFSGRHFVENRPERKEVGTGVHRQTERLFGAHVARCADKLAHLRPLKRGRISVAHSRYPEVEQFHGLPVFGDQNVGWLHVAMHDAHAMRIAESLGELQS